MTAYTRRLIIVVTASAAGAANARAKEVDPEGGERAFTAGLSPTGEEPATHYWCSWALRESDDGAMRTKLAAAVAAGLARVFNGNARTPESVLAELGLAMVGRGPAGA